MNISIHNAWSKLLLILLLFFVLFVCTGALKTQVRFMSGEEVTATGDLDDVAFFAGGNLNISVNSSDDVYAAGGNAVIDNLRADHLFLAGGDIILTDTNVADLTTAGGNASFISGTVEDDAVIAGGDILIGNGFEIRGSALLAAGHARLDGPFGGELRATAGQITLNSIVEGDVYLVGDDVTIGPDARIDGNLHHRTDKLELDPAAAIAGTVIELKEIQRLDAEALGAGAAAMAAFLSLAFAIGTALLILVIVLFFPELMNSTTMMIRQRPMSSIGIGFLTIIVVPVILGFLAISAIGLPLALFAGLLFITAVPVGVAASIYFISMMLRRRVQEDTMPARPGARILWSLPAVIVVVLIGFIPIIGGLVWLIAWVMGMGAVVSVSSKLLGRNP